MNAGYDKIALWIDRAIVGDQYPTIATYLDGANTQINNNTGEVKTKGYLRGLLVTIYAGGLSIVGSLPKFYFDGSNVYPLDRNSTHQALEMLGDTLHISVMDARVTEIEFGANMLMQHPVEDYISRLGDMPRLRRYLFDPSTLYYMGGGKRRSKVFRVYDKLADAVAKGMQYPQDLQGANLLRCEMGLKGSLPYRLSVPMVQASTLYELAFCRNIARVFFDMYNSIFKLNQIKKEFMIEIKKVPDAEKAYWALKARQAGLDDLEEFINELKKNGVFKDRKSYSRLKKRIKEVATSANVTTSDELIRELDDEIKNSVAYL